MNIRRSIAPAFLLLTPLLLAPTLLSWKPGRSEARLPLPVPPPKMLLRVLASSMASTFCRR